MRRERGRAGHCPKPSTRSRPFLPLFPTHTPFAPSSPRTQLCERPAGRGYKGSEFFRVQKGFAVFGGDWRLNTGRGGQCVFGTDSFADENFIGRHSQPGVIGMANHGVHTNTSVFYITLTPAPHLGESG